MITAIATKIREPAMIIIMVRELLGS